MKAEAYRDYLLEKYCNDGKSYGIVCHDISVNEPNEISIKRVFSFEENRFGATSAR